MREILFRGKRTENGEWVYGEYFGLCAVANDDGEVALKYLIHQSNDEPLYSVDAETVGQYTGLKDKNGKKIFEGDIVKCKHKLHGLIENKRDVKIPHHSYGLVFEEKWFSDTKNWLEAVYYRNYEVQFYRGSYRIKNKSITHEISYRYIINHDVEVVGTIYDNPELL